MNDIITHSTNSGVALNKAEKGKVTAHIQIEEALAKIPAKVANLVRYSFRKYQYSIFFDGDGEQIHSHTPKGVSIRTEIIMWASDGSEAVLDWIKATPMPMMVELVKLMSK